MHPFIAATDSKIGETLTVLPIPPAAVGILTMSTFVFLLLVTFAFRSIGSRHR